MAGRALGALALPLIVVCAGALLGGCGPQGGIWLQVGAPLRIPEDVDGLGVLARWGGAEGAVAFDQSYDLEPQLSFPLTLSLTAEQVQPGEVLWVEARALKEGQQARSWSRVSAEVLLERQQLAELSVQMCDCP